MLFMACRMNRLFKCCCLCPWPTSLTCQNKYPAVTLGNIIHKRPSPRQSVGTLTSMRDTKWSSSCPVEQWSNAPAMQVWLNPEACSRLDRRERSSSAVEGVVLLSLTAAATARTSSSREVFMAGCVVTSECCVAVCDWEQSVSVKRLV